MAILEIWQRENKVIIEKSECEDLFGNSSTYFEGG
jgi:hypothetical protein